MYITVAQRSIGAPEFLKVKFTHFSFIYIFFIFFYIQTKKPQLVRTEKGAHLSNLISLAIKFKHTLTIIPQNGAHDLEMRPMTFNYQVHLET